MNKLQDAITKAKEQRGDGLGNGGDRQGDGGAVKDVCPKCGYSEPHTKGSPAANKKCPKCGTIMIGEKMSKLSDAIEAVKNEAKIPSSQRSKVIKEISNLLRTFVRDDVEAMINSKNLIDDPDTIDDLMMALSTSLNQAVKDTILKLK